MRLHTTVVAIIALLALAATGCGGPSADEKWAASVCTAMDDYTTDMFDAYDRVQRTRATPGRDNKADMYGAIYAGLRHTDKLATRLKAIDSPPTRSGRRAKRLVDWEVGHARKPLEEMQRKLRKLPESLTLVQNSLLLNDLELALVTAVNFGTSTPPPNIFPVLGKVFQESDECSRLLADLKGGS